MIIFAALFIIFAGGYCIAREWHLGTLLCLGLLIYTIQSAEQQPSHPSSTMTHDYQGEP